MPTGWDPALPYALGERGQSNNFFSQRHRQTKLDLSNSGSVWWIRALGGPSAIIAGNLPSGDCKFLPFF